MLDPIEVLRRAVDLDFRALALTEHVNGSNVEHMAAHLARVSESARMLPLTFIAGVEITGVPPEEIASIARRAKQAGVRLVVVHGETLMGGAPPGTNLAAAQCPDVDLLGHPGLLSEEAARAALANDVFIEISGREIHSLTNGHIAKLATRLGNKLVVNSDAHRPDQLLTLARAALIARGAGLEEPEIERALVNNPEELLARTQRRPI